MSLPRRFELRLQDGSLIPSPAYGNGSGKTKDTELFMTTGKMALDAGFYHIDTAQLYGGGHQEAATGKLLKDVPKDQVFLTSKLSATGPDFQDPWPIEQIRGSVIDSVGKLGRKPDLFLIHQPYAVGDGSGAPEQLVAAWKVLEELKDDGILKSIGVSNFRPQDIQALLDHCLYKPAVNQMEFHPQVLSHVEGLLKLQQEHGIITESYGPLTPFLRNRGSRLDPVLKQIAERLTQESGKPVDENFVLLLWCHAMDVIVVTTSTNEQRIKSMAAVTELPQLTQAEVDKISELGKQTYFRHYNEHMENAFPTPKLPTK